MQQPTRFDFKITHGLFIVVALCGHTFAETRSADEPMNVVLLFADDWRHDTLGCAGHPVVKTPSLDRLASNGVRFVNNYVTTSICGVSRASLLTGQWMSRHGNRSFGPFETAWTDTFPGVFRDAGYQVAHVGKWHNGPFPKERFDFGTSYYGKHWMKPRPGQGRRLIHVTEQNEIDALEFLTARPRDQPFVLTVAFFATHAEDNHPLQFLPQPESMSLYDSIGIPVPPNATDASFERLPEFVSRESNEGRNRWHWRFDTPEKYQSMMKNYYRLASEVDATCGRVIELLEAQGALDQTMIIFTTDNGYYHAEHGLADKWYPHQESIRVPLIVFDPRLPDAQRGRTHDAMTLNVDLAPTMLTSCGLSVPETMQGRDLSPLWLGDTPDDWRTDFFYEHPVIRSNDFIPASEALVEKEWKYFYWPDFDREQLFHLATDPLEESDLVDDPVHQDRLLAMRKRFQELKADAK